MPVVEAPVVSTPPIKQATMPMATTTTEELAAATPVVAGTCATAPLVGVFYRASSPDSEPFVKVGQQVKKGDVLCIIEAMKLMNEVEAEVDGEVVEILVGDEEMVEYGQNLFVIR